MSEIMGEKLAGNPFGSPLVPILLADTDKINFNCHRNISCFNACCKHADITLTPYDIVRMKTHLGMSSTEFLKQHTVPFEMDAHGVPGVKMRTEDEQPVCLFMNDQGCRIYEDRPSACRYYPLGLMSMRAQNSPDDEKHFFVVKEDHCKGHAEPQAERTIAEYRKEQGVSQYDELNREWFQIVLKKRSSGMTVGAPSATSLQLFFMASYDIDRFRDFVMSENFQKLYVISEQQRLSFKQDEITLMAFSFQFLKQVLFGEKTIDTRDDVIKTRFEGRKEILAARIAADQAAKKAKDDPYSYNA